MNKPTSFISEHSAEYALIPEITNILKRKFNQVTPIFPWATREGSKISNLIHQEELIKIIGIFPRRPKLKKSDNTEISITVNSELISGATRAKDYGIPMVAGCPLVRSFWELGNCKKFAWIKLGKNTLESYTLSKSDRPSEQEATHFLTKNQILNLAQNTSTFLTLPEFIEAYKHIKREGSSKEPYYYGSRTFFGSYKPFYLLMK